MPSKKQNLKISKPPRQNGGRVDALVSLYFN